MIIGKRIRKKDETKNESMTMRAQTKKRKQVKMIIETKMTKNEYAGRIMRIDKGKNENK